jgi:class 3 adenylate cyclase
LAREQRRLAAIVAADVVGYSRLMGRDESGTLARTSGFDQAVARRPLLILPYMIALAIIWRS